MSGDTKKDNIHNMNNNRNFTSEQLSQWGSVNQRLSNTGGRPKEYTDE